MVRTLAVGGPFHGRVFASNPRWYDERYRLWERGPWKLWIAWEIDDPILYLTGNWRAACAA